TSYTISELDNILNYIRNITEEKKHKIVENNTKKYKIHCIDELIKAFSCSPSIKNDIFPVLKNLTNLKNSEQDIIQLPITCNLFCKIIDTYKPSKPLKNCFSANNFLRLANVSEKFLFSDSVKDSLHDVISKPYFLLQQDNKILNNIFQNEISKDEIQSCGNILKKWYAKNGMLKIFNNACK
ncbi:3920_t:CDS:2, partial [Cetraspora pellucida]